MNETQQKMQQALATYRASKSGGAPAAPVVSETPAPIAPIAPSPDNQPSPSIDDALSKYRSARASGAPAYKPSSEPQKSFGDKALGVVKSIVSAPATMVARPVEALAVGGARLFGGQEAADKTANAIDDFAKDKLGGFVAPIPRSGAEVKQDAGRAIQTVALGAPGVASGGALFGVGNSLEQGNDLFSTQTAFQGVLGAGAGKVLDLIGKPLLNSFGKVIGKITPQVLKDVAAKGSAAISEFAANHSILPKAASDVINKTSSKIESILNAPADLAKKLVQSRAGVAEKQLEDKYVELFEGGSPSKQKQFFNTQKATEAKNAAGTEGTPPQRTLAEAHVIPKQEGNKIKTLEQADEFRATASPFQKINRTALQEIEKTVPKVNLLDQEEKAVALIKTPRNINEGTAKSLEKEIRSEYSDLRSHYGDDVPITVLDDIKSARWKPIKFDKFNANRPLLGDANYAIAKTAQKTIENTASSVGAEDIAQVNRHIGDIMEGAKYLEGLNGRTIKGGGLDKLALKGAGFLLGNSIPAKIAGYFGGEAVANMIIANKISGPIQRMILKNIESKEGPAALKATVKWIEEQRAARAATPAPLQLMDKNPQTPSTLFATPKGKISPIKQEATDIGAIETGAVKAPKQGRSQRAKLAEILNQNEPYLSPKEMPTIKAGTVPKPSGRTKRLNEVYGDLPEIQMSSKKKGSQKGFSGIKTTLAGAGLGATVVGAAKLKDMYTQPPQQALAAEIQPAETKVVKTETMPGGRVVHTLDSGNKVVDIHPDVKKALTKVYKDNPNIEPGTLEALLMKESSGGYDDANKNPKIGKYAWLGGIAGGNAGAKAELDRLGIKYDLNTIPGALDAMAKYWTVVQKRNKGKTPIEIYDKGGYSSGKLKSKDISLFKDFLDYYSS